MLPMIIQYKQFQFPTTDYKTLVKSLSLGLFVYVVILGGFVIVQTIVSLEMIRDSLLNQVNVNRENFIFVALYISFINSWIEEFFFRGFGYFKMKLFLGKNLSMILSSLLFAIYHISIVKDWAHPLIVTLSILGLFFIGIFFILLNERNQNILSSWMVHMFANLAINTIGLHMFGIIQLPFLR
jgi:membrane protease YdiL (CAAX protease family)